MASKDAKRPWPFVGNSLFLYRPEQDDNSKKILEHVLELLRADFKIENDRTDPRFQVLLNEVVDAYARLAVLRSEAMHTAATEGEDKIAPTVELRERSLMGEASKAINVLMQYTNSRKSEKRISFETVLRSREE